MNSRCHPWILTFVVGCSLGVVPGCGSGLESTEPPSRSVHMDNFGRFEEVESRVPTSVPAAAAGLISDREELLILERTGVATEDPANGGRGRLLARCRDDDEGEPLTLEFTDVQASVHASIATVDVTQRFRNHFEEVIEAEYVFPLPQDAAIRDFVMVIGTRRIRGILREKEEARRIYAAARAAGHTVSLLTQSRPNIFVQKVANIEPGHRIDVAIRYFHALPYRDDAYEFAFPLTIGPRFHPPGMRRSDSSPSVPYTTSERGDRSRVHLELTIAGHSTIENVECATHRADVEREGDRVRVTLRDREDSANRDFVVRYNVPREELSGSLVTQEDGNGGTFALLLHPPRSRTDGPEEALELIFLVDCSGSMSGEPIRQVKEALLLALDRIGSEDTFQIIQFSDSASAMTDDPISGTPEHRRRAERYVRGLEAKGGTMMLEGISEALERKDDEGRTRYLCLLTDGFIGNEPEILTRVGERLGRNRIFSFGVGSSPNRFLMESLAAVGQGAVEFLNPSDDAKPILRRFLDRVRRPALARVDLTFPDGDVFDVYPSRIPDLYAGRPVMVTGRYRGAAPSEARVQGRWSGRRYDRSFPTLGHAARARASLDALWARQRISDLTYQGYLHPRRSRALGQQILDTALEHGLVSQFTAFVAVDAREVVGDGPPERTVVVSVPLPQGTEFRASEGGVDREKR